MRIVLIGPPGAGKGTQAALLQEYLRVPHISTGELFRAAKRAGTEAGLEAAKYSEAGKLIPCDIVLALVAETLASEECRNGCLLDGFPRTVKQAQALDKLLADSGTSVDRVVQLTIDEEELVARLSKRGRLDDTEEVIRERFHQFRDQTAPVIEHYCRQDLVSSIDAVGTMDEVFGRIKEAVDESKE